MAETKKRTNPVTFLNQVRAEARKVTWTSQQETVAATIMVLIMVVLAAVFFLLTDQVTSWAVGLITGIR